MENHLRLRSLAWLLLLAIPFLFTQCKVESMQVNFIQNTEGLKPEHLSATPLLEQVFCHPEGNGCETTRIYADGAMYFFVPMEKDAEPSIWAYMTVIKQPGLDLLNEVFESVCKVKEPHVPGGSAEGSMTYRYHISKCAREVTIYGVDYGPYAPLDDIANIINANLTPITFPKK